MFWLGLTHQMSPHRDQRPHLAQCVTAPHKFTCQMASKSVQHSKQGCKCDRQTDRLTTLQKMCSNRRNHFTRAIPPNNSRHDDIVYTMLHNTQCQSLTAIKHKHLSLTVLPSDRTSFKTHFQSLQTLQHLTETERWGSEKKDSTGLDMRCEWIISAYHSKHCTGRYQPG